jgi:DNA-binding NarL/FixJ family response regulator
LLAWEGMAIALYRGVIQKTERVGQRRLRALIAEDSPGMRQNLADLLSGLPQMEVVGTAGDGIEAVESVHSLKPDVMTLDIHMPRRNGLEVLRIIRKEKNHCVVIVLTKLADDFYRQKCRELKADYFFDKVTEFEQFVELLKQMQPL